MINNQYQYLVTERRGTFEMIPLNESGMNIEKKFYEDGRFDYSETLTGELTFSKSDFQRLLRLETSIYRTENITITVKSKTDPDKIFFTGQINFSDGSWNLDKCTLKIKAQALDGYRQYEDKKDNEVDLFVLVPVRKVVTLTDPDVEFEEVTYTLDGPCVQLAYWGGVGNAYEQGYEVYKTVYTNNAGVCSNVTSWIREVKTVDCDIDLTDDGYIMVEDNCPANRKWARHPGLYDYNRTISTVGDITTDTQQYKVLGKDSTIEMDNGMSFTDIMEAFAQTIVGTGTIVKSDFFQINPDTPSANNYVTLKESTTGKIHVFQKSDVKRYNANINAVNASGMTMAKWMSYLVMMFNVRWKVKDGVLRLEHITWFRRDIICDLTLPEFARFFYGKRVYTYDKDKLPYIEVFQFKEAKEVDVYGTPIEYDSTTADRSINGRKEYKVDNVTTDVLMVIGNPDPNSTTVSDLGFVMLSCREVGGDLSVIRKKGILGKSVPNNPFGWSHLHNDFHKYDRPFKRGRMNLVLQEFSTIRFTKRGAEVFIPNCPYNIKPESSFKTPLGFGDGILDNARYDMQLGGWRFSILYDPTHNLFINTIPTAVNDTAAVLMNNSVVIDVMANDTDEEGDVTSIVIFGNPAHGAVVVNADKTVTYTPNPGYYGPDYFVYQLRDEWGELSNPAYVNITVQRDETYPVANPDIYYVAKNTVLNVPALTGVLANDTDDEPGLAVVPGVIATSQGGSVTLNADGSFSYTPPSPVFVGTDTWNYTAIDTDTHTATGSVQIVVRENVYARLVAFDNINTPIYKNCDGVDTYTGNSVKESYKVEFFSDPAATTPLNVTGYGLQLLIQVDTRSVPGGPVNTNVYAFGAAGTEQIIVLQRTIKVDDHYCNGSQLYYLEETRLLLANTGYSVI